MPRIIRRAIRVIVHRVSLSGNVASIFRSYRQFSFSINAVESTRIANPVPRHFSRAASPKIFGEVARNDF